MSTNTPGKKKLVFISFRAANRSQFTSRTGASAPAPEPTPQAASGRTAGTTSTFRGHP